MDGLDSGKSVEYSGPDLASERPGVQLNGGLDGRV